MATKLDRIRAKVLEYDSYSNALDVFVKLSDSDRMLALTDKTIRGYLYRASDAGNTPECRLVRNQLTPPNRVIVDALKSALAMFDKGHCIANFNWGASALSAANIAELNEMPAKLTAAIREAQL